jgi:uncharacterized protein YkwD
VAGLRAHRRNILRLIVICALVLPASFSRASTSKVTAADWFTASERCIMREINSIRTRHGLKRLKWDVHLGFVARRHAKGMAKVKGMYHDEGLAQKITRWSSLAQNTGKGRPCKKIMKSFMGSQVHRANILGDWEFIGVGTEWRSHRLFVQQIFERGRNPGNIYHRPGNVGN